MNQVLPFPKEKSKRVLRTKKVEGQRLFLTFSLFSFILIAVVTNEQMMKSQRPVYIISDNSTQSIEQVNRAIASAQPLNLFRDVEWEHQLAKKLADGENRAPASVSQKLTLVDQLRYGVLAGKYHIVSTGKNEPSKISEIDYVDSNGISDRPVQISDHAGFLMEYGPLMPVDFKRVTLNDTKDGTENWSLISESGSVVGHANLRFDETGKFLGFKVQPLDRVSAE